MPIIQPFLKITGIIFFFAKYSLKIKLGVLTMLTLVFTNPLIAQSLDGTPLTTSELAKMWIHGRVVRQSLIAKEAYTPDLSPADFYIVDIPLDVNVPNIVAPYYNIGWYREFDYIIICVGVRERYRANPEKFVNQNKFYDALQQTWTLAAKFVGEELIGSEIRIYKNPAPRSSPELYPPELYTTLEGASLPVARDLLAQLARLYRNGGWHPKAIDIYQNLLLIVPDHPALYAELATSYYALDLKDQAIIAYEHALKKDPTNMAILTNLGTVCFQQDQFTKAAHYWERALAQQPNNLDHINNLVFLYTQQNQSNRAIALLQTALKHHPDNSELQSVLESLTQ